MIKWILVGGGFLALAVFQTRSLLAHFGTHLASQGGDIFFLAYVLAWDAHALSTHPFRLFDANMGYPLERSLAYSDHLLGVAPIFAPVYLITGNAVAAYNTVLLLSGFVGALGAFALAWWWTRRWWPSIVAGTIFGWAPLRLSQIGHLQMLTFFWAPWALLFLDRFLRARRWLDLWIFALFYWLQVLSSFYLGMMLTVAVVLYVGYHACAVDRTLLGRALAGRAAAFVAASVVVLLPFHFAYFEIQRAWQASWTPGALAGFSADVQSYLAAPPQVNDLYVSLFRPVTPMGAHERLLFPGLLLLTLVGLAFVARVRGVAPAEVRRARRVFGLVALVAFVLSLGPYLVFWGVNTKIPMPYLLLYYVVPTWSAMRVPARFAFLVMVALIPLSALGAQVVIERAAAWRAGATWRRLAEPATGLVLVGLFLLELGAKPLPLQAAPSGRDVPDVYRWLARERPGPLVEVPVGFTDRDQKYLYLSTFHWLPTVNGRSSFTPSSFDAMKATLGELPGPRGRQCAAALGLRAIVVHGDELSREERGRWAAVEQAGHLRRVAAFGSDVVYGVDAIALAPSLRVDLAAPEALPIGADATIGLRLESEATRPWAQRAPHRVARGAVRWTSLDGATPHVARVAVTLPLTVGAGERAPLPLRISAPVKAGRYTLEVELDVPPVTTARHTVEIRDGPRPATSADAGAHLTARYVLPDGEAPRRLDQGASLRLRVVAVNAGDALWLAKPRGKKGDVALHWGWLDETGRSALDRAGRARIRYDVYPGQSYEFDEWPAPPTLAGRYVLEAGLVVEGIGAFASGPALRIDVAVGR